MSWRISGDSHPTLPASNDIFGVNVFETSSGAPHVVGFQFLIDFAEGTVDCCSTNLRLLSSFEPVSVL